MPAAPRAENPPPTAPPRPSATAASAPRALAAAAQSPAPGAPPRPEAEARPGARTAPTADGPDFGDIPDFGGDQGGPAAGSEASAGARSDAAFPPTWRDLVEAWKRGKPLQARKLEEAHPLVYSRERIALAVPEDSFASKILLKPDEQARIREQFRELFGFNGTLVVTPRGQAAAATAAPLPDTLLDTRSKEADGRRQKLVDDARNAPLTKEVLAVLGGTIEDVRTL